MITFHQQYKTGLIWLAFIIFIGIIYFPGMSGIFLLDDHPNLDTLKRINGITDWKNIITFSINGLSSSIGRPLSLFTFALQANAWPDYPGLFKLVNFFIHIINGFLIYLLANKLLVLGKIEQESARNYALLTAFIWLIHPMQVSTVLYVVQRMTQLATLFILTGILVYLKGRLITDSDKTLKSHLWMTTGIGITLFFGILSKENAILVCLLILVIEWTILSSVPKPRYWKTWAALCTILPLVALSVYLAPKVIPYLTTDYPTRSYSALTRQLTETRVLGDYLSNIIFPRPQSFGLFHSNYGVSKSLFNPISTLWFTILLLFIFIVAIIVRKKLPLISFGILWFFAGHVLESTVVGLELYFEHRNYIPIFGIIISIIGLTSIVRKKLKSRDLKKGNIAIMIGVFMWVSGLSFITYKETILWGNPFLQAAVWAETDKTSFRTQGHYISLLSRYGELKKAKEILKRNTHSFKNDSTQIMHWINLRCHDKDLELPSNSLIEEKFSGSNYFNGTIKMIDHIILDKESDKCTGIENKLLEKILTILSENKNFQSDRTKLAIYTLKGKLYSLDGQYKKTIENYNYAYQLKPSVALLLLSSDLHLRLSNIEWYLKTMRKVDEVCNGWSPECMKHDAWLKGHYKVRKRIEEARNKKSSIKE